MKQVVAVTKRMDKVSISQLPERSFDNNARRTPTLATKQVECVAEGEPLMINCTKLGKVIAWGRLKLRINITCVFRSC